MFIALSLLVFCLFSAIPGAAASDSAGAPTAKSESEEGEKREFKAPYRDSEVVYRNVVSARSFNRNADLTYNPYYAMELELSPTFWLGEHLFSALDVSLVRELTNSDTTTKEGETVLQDIYLAFGAPKVVTIPVVKIDVSPSIRFYTPASKVSRARTRAVAR